MPPLQLALTSKAVSWLLTTLPLCYSVQDEKDKQQCSMRKKSPLTVRNNECKTLNSQKRQEAAPSFLGVMRQKKKKNQCWWGRHKHDCLYSLIHSPHLSFPSAPPLKQHPHHPILLFLSWRLDHVLFDLMNAHISPGAA